MLFQISDSVRALPGKVWSLSCKHEELAASVAASTFPRHIDLSNLYLSAVTAQVPQAERGFLAGKNEATKP
jgi:hypothetical protein